MSGRGWVLLFAASLASASEGPLDSELLARVRAGSLQSLVEYRLPVGSDLTGDWASAPKAWRADADFDGDGSVDTAVLLPRRSGPGYRLLVLLGPRGEQRAIVLEDQPWPVQGFGLAVVPPGRYRTAAGKGYDVPAGDPREITVSLPVLDRHHFESWNGFWYWVSKERTFRHVQVSD